MEVNGNANSNGGSVIAVHLANGQTILGRALPTPFGDATIRIKKPMSLIVQPGPQQGALAVSMLPYLSSGVFSILEEFEFEQPHVMLVRAVPTQMEKMYIEMTTGLTIAPSGLIKP
jgi:hypothetical protein